MKNHLIALARPLRTFVLVNTRLTKMTLRPASNIHSSAMAKPEHFNDTSGETDAVWIHQEPYSNRPKFPRLTQDIETDVCIVGAGIAGIQTAYELVTRGVSVVMIEAREVLSGETGRTSGHLASSLDDGYLEIAKKHKQEGAKQAADSHTWAIHRLGEIAKKLGVECEYRQLPAVELSQWPRGDPKHEEEMKELQKEVKFARELGLDCEYREGYAVKGWDGKPDQRDAAIFNNQATFHPTKYLVGVLKWLSTQPNFTCYTHTRMMDIEEKGAGFLGLGHKTVKVSTEGGNTISCNNAVEATCIPLQKLSIVAELEFHRTYCIAVRVRKGTIEDALIYDQAEEYKYARLTACDDMDDYLVVGGCDHKVGQEEPTGRFEELETWVRERFTHAGSVDYRWSGQVMEPVDYMAFIGKNPGKNHIYIMTGDSGDGLTHYVLGGKLIADEMQEIPNPWAELYSPKRMASIAKSLTSMVSHDLQINTQYKRFLQSDIQDIEDLPNGEGGVLNKLDLKKPIAVYKDDEGNVHKFSALCPHLHGVVCWNRLEKSWDCPVHGSRFSKDGLCVMGPAKRNLTPEDAAGQESQKIAVEA